MRQKIETSLFNMCMIQDPKTQRVVVLNKVNSDWQGVTFPGGKIENGESFIASTIREVFEETGLEVRNLKPCGLINWYNTENHERWLVFLYRTSDYQGDLVEQTTEGAVSWRSLDDIPKEHWAPNMETYLKLFLDENLHEAYATWNQQSQTKLTIV